eukprot:CAMPEP_0204151686 /NCGR_PEP_ID=MMETSP0361-20130328/26385_1 /ASSEMBLY_ACC=CAM_ASM_000343 /TAXON_ID=268821 /ORGANISM="Scrippsiella Hangoei, Strain SHTV-5" /LENGTH=77 /DNA_ID=CAMNT_0051106537 /DNA_START=17 /DNA_END=247 /DNA_ORIENTATION=+
MILAVSGEPIVLSPVNRHTSAAPNSFANSPYFWFDRALMGVVYTTRLSLSDARHNEIASRAIVVLPALVGAATSMLS